MTIAVTKKCVHNASWGDVQYVAVKVNVASHSSVVNKNHCVHLRET